jgi:glutamyl-tRNA reductase
VQQSLVIIGLNFRTASLEIRERFWISEVRRYEALHQLVRSEGVDEAVVLSTPYRTEFILWASDASSAANSVLRFLTREYNLKLCEWSNFYRLLDEAALIHLFRLTSALDTVAVGETGILSYVTAAWDHAEKAGTLGRFLNSVFESSLAISRRVLNETVAGTPSVSVASAVIDLSRTVLTSLEGKRVLLLGSGKMGEVAASALLRVGAKPLLVTNRDQQRAEAVATKLGGVSIPFEQRWQAVAECDILVSCTSCPHPVVLREHLASVMPQRSGRGLVVLDLSVPRDVQPSVGELPGVHLFNVRQVEELLARQQGTVVLKDAQALISGAVSDCRKNLLAAQELPSLENARSRLDEVCRRELDVLREELGPFTEDQEQVLSRLASNITQRISSQLARELYAAPGRTQREQLSSVIERLFSTDKKESEQRAVNR